MTLTMKQEQQKQQKQPENALTRTPENSLPTKNIGVNCVTCHLYSLQ